MKICIVTAVLFKLSRLIFRINQRKVSYTIEVITLSRLLAIGDIHGCYDKLVELLNKVNYQPGKDQLVLLGDYIDRGPKSRETIDLVIELVNNGAIALKGNHEDMLINALDDVNSCELWLYNGGKKTLRSYHISGGYGNIPWHEQPRRIPQKHLDFIRNLPISHETDEYIFVHAGLPLYATKVEEAEHHDLMWVRDEWLTREYKGKVVVFGHTPTFTIQGHKKPEPWFGKNKIDIDTGAIYSKYGGKLTCLQLPTMVWQV